MMLAAAKGSEIVIQVEGEDAEKAIDELAEFLLTEMEKISIKRRSPRREVQPAGKNNGRK